MLFSIFITVSFIQVVTCISSSINRCTIQALFPENYKNLIDLRIIDTWPLGAQSFIESLPENPPGFLFGNLNDLFEDISLLEGYFNNVGIVRSYVSEICFFLFLISLPQVDLDVLRRLRRALVNHAIISWSTTIKREVERKELRTLIAKIDLRYQEIKMIPSNYIIEGYDLEFYERLNNSFLEIHPKGKYQCPDSLQTPPPPYFIYHMKKLYSEKFFGEVINKKLDSINENFDKNLKSYTGKIFTIFDWIKAWRQFEPTRREVGGVQIVNNWSFDRAFLLGPFPYCPNPS